MPSICFTDKCGIERNRALSAITVGSGTQLHPRSTNYENEGSRLVRRKARDGYCVGSQTLRTEARAPAIKMPHAEKREIQWKRNGRNEWMTERRGRERNCLALFSTVTIGGGSVPAAAVQSHSRSLAWANRKRTPGWTPLAFHSTSFSTFDLPSILPPSRLHHSAVTVVLSATFFLTNDYRNFDDL